MLVRPFHHVLYCNLVSFSGKNVSIFFEESGYFYMMYSYEAIGYCNVKKSFVEFERWKCRNCQNNRVLDFMTGACAFIYPKLHTKQMQWPINLIIFSDHLAHVHHLWWIVTRLQASSKLAKHYDYRFQIWLFTITKLKRRNA